MSKRLAMLEHVTQAGKADSFSWYALALEYKSCGRIEDASRTFSRLREIDPSYVPMYLMAGSMLVEVGQTEEAREWLRTGIERARSAGNEHARLEMEAILESIEE